MRNLKKFLALALAMIMAFSLMLTASAKTTGTQFDDAKDVTPAFEEAVDVLVGMKVFQGDEKGFRPASNITRAEMATLIYRLATGDVTTDKMDLYTTNHPFVDVKADDWFAGYVGYCWNAGYIKGTSATTFNPYANVTGYEALAMVLRAMGYDANDEFTGSQWIVNVSAIATQRGLLKDIKSTHYATTLHLASRRDVVASIMFNAAQATRVKYTPAYGYQTGDHTSSAVTDLYTDYSSLGWVNFGLVSTDEGVVIGNQQTGEKNTRLGFGGTVNVGRLVDPITSTRSVSGGVSVTGVNRVTGYDDSANATVSVPFTVTPYAWEGTYDVENSNLTLADGTAFSATDDTITLTGNNDTFNVETGIDLIGHNVKIWFDGRGDRLTETGRTTYAYYDKATKTDVVTVKDNTTARTANDATTPVTSLASGEAQAEYDVGERNLNDVAKAAGFTLNTAKTAVFNNSFGKFGTSDAAGAEFTNDNLVGTGVATNQAQAIASPVRLYKLIANGNLTNHNDQLDAVIALNIETSQITESNTVNRVPTIGVPVSNIGTVSNDDNDDDTVEKAQLETNFITDANEDKAGENVHQVPNTADGVVTGVIAKDALVGNSTSTLSDYEFGVHITGTTPRTVSSAEKTAINGTGIETAYFLMSKVSVGASGKVLAYNVNEGTVTLENGTVLNRSKYYNTVANKNDDHYTIYRDLLTYANNNTNTELAAAKWALPQSTDQYGAESYNRDVTYDFYFDFEGNYLGAERSHGNSFIYGTYVDYAQDTSTSTFKFYLTGINLEGKMVTEEVKSFWAQDGYNPNGGVFPLIDLNQPQADHKSVTITGTNNLDVPFRDTVGGTGVMNFIGTGIYRGFTLSSAGRLDPFLTADTINQTDYFENMARIGVYRAVQADDTTTNGLMKDIVIDNDIKTLGAIQTEVATVDNQHPDAGVNGDSKLYFTEDTKFIVVDGYGTDSVGSKTVVYDGISALLGTSSRVTIDLGTEDDGVTPAVTASQRLVNDIPHARMTYFTKSPYVYAQTGDVCEKVDVIILPKDAVKRTATAETLFYMGDPNYTLISSHNSEPVYQYTVYRDGVAQKVWLDNEPNEVYPDTFLMLNVSGTEVSGDTTYTAAFLDNTTGYDQDHSPYTSDPTSDHTNLAGYNAFKGDTRKGWAAISGTEDAWDGANGTTAALIYSAQTRNAQSATFTWFGAAPGSVFLRVAEAKVTNLNAANAPSKQIWPGITDLATLNEAGSINPVTSRALKVAAQLDPTNPLVVTHIYVCWDQTPNP